MLICGSTELKDICHFISGGTPSRKVPEYFSGTIPWITGADINENVITKARDYITEDAIRNSATKIVPQGSILLVTRTGVGKVAIAGTDICISQDLTGLELDYNKVNNWYLFYFLLSQQSLLTDQQRGATIQGITRDIVENLCLPLPPLPEQQRIAAILQKADRLRRLRRYARQLSDGYLQSVFLEMFGDPKSNQEKWKKGRIEDISLLVTDGEHITPNRTSSGIKLLSARNIQNGYIDFEAEIDFISVEEYERIKKRCNPEFEDILISCSGSVGRVTTIRTHEPFTLVRSVALIKPNKKQIQPYYLEHFLRTEYSQEMIERYSKASSQANLFQGPIKDLPVLIPSMSEQEKFVECVKKYVHAKKLSTESERQTEILFQSLLQRAFQGEQ